MDWLFRKLYDFRLKWAVKDYVERDRIITVLDERMDCPECGTRKGMRIKSMEEGFICTRCDHLLSYTKFSITRRSLGRSLLRKYEWTDGEFWRIVKLYGLDL